MRVLLTFDDAPVAAMPATLGVLERHGVRAVFFVVGQHVVLQTRGLKWLRDAVEAGHAVGNHGYHHFNMTTLEPQVQAAEILATEALLGGLLGEQRLFRPPYGLYDDSLLNQAARLRYTTVLWTVGFDHRDLVEFWPRWLRGASGDHICLVHERKTPAPQLDWAIRAALDGGVKFLTPGDVAACIRAWSFPGVARSPLPLM